MPVNSLDCYAGGVSAERPPRCSLGKINRGNDINVAKRHTGELERVQNGIQKPTCGNMYINPYAYRISRQWSADFRFEEVVGNWSSGNGQDRRSSALLR